MYYMLVVSQDVAISPQDFVVQWNANPTCCTVARASVDYSTKYVYEPCATGAPLPTLDLFDEDGATQPFYELIKTVLCKQPVGKSPEIIQLEKPNGTRILLIKDAQAGL